jgi:hypothetical protein
LRVELDKCKHFEEQVDGNEGSCEIFTFELLAVCSDFFFQLLADAVFLDKLFSLGFIHSFETNFEVSYFLLLIEFMFDGSLLEVVNFHLEFSVDSIVKLRFFNHHILLSLRCASTALFSLLVFSLN